MITGTWYIRDFIALTVGSRPVDAPLLKVRYTLYIVHARGSLKNHQMVFSSIRESPSKESFPEAISQQLYHSWLTYYPQSS